MNKISTLNLNYFLTQVFVVKDTYKVGPVILILLIFQLHIRITLS